MFSVVSVVKEDEAVLRRFVGYYLSQGAERIVLFFDGVCPIEVSEWSPGSVEIHNMDLAFKAQNETGDPKDLIATQEMVFTNIHEKNQADWLLVVDADEFVVVPDGKLSEALKDLDPKVEAIRFPVGEAVWGPDDDDSLEFGCTHFRFPMGRIYARLLSRALYGKLSRLYRRGLLGHIGGKHAVRRGVSVDKVGCHHSWRGGRPIGIWTNGAGRQFSQSFVAHFDAISFVRWKEKWARRFNDEVRILGMGLGRSRQVEEARNAYRVGRMRDYFRQLYGLPPWKAKLLANFGLLRRTNVFGAVQSEAAPSARQ